MISIDYLTVSLGGGYISSDIGSTKSVLNEFSRILPDLYKRTCKDILCVEGSSMRVSQYGICVALQYGSALARGWKYSVQLSGDYWHAIERDRNALLPILEKFTVWRVSRLDLERTVTVPLEDLRGFYRSAFEAGHRISGEMDSRTIYYGSRKSQFFTRVYNKTAQDSKHYPAPAEFAQVRFEVEIHRVKGELVLEHSFDSEFTDRLFVQRVQCSAKYDSSGFILKYFGDVHSDKIRTVKRQIGDLERTIDYVFKAYAPYISAGLHSQLVANRYDDIATLGKKGEKILAVIDSELETHYTDEEERVLSK